MARNLRRIAKRDVASVYRPAFKDARQDFRNDRHRVGNIYGRANDALAALTPMYTGALGAQNSALADSLSGIAANSNPDVARLLGTIGQGFASTMAAGNQGALANLRAGQQAGILNRADLEANVLRNYRDLVQDLRTQRGADVFARLDALREQRQAKKLADRDFGIAEAELHLREELANKDDAFRNRAYRNERGDEREARNFTLQQAESKLDRAKVRPLRNDIETLQEAIQRLEDLQRSVDRPNASIDRRIDRKREKVQRKKRKVRKIKRTDSYR